MIRKYINLHIMYSPPDNGKAAGLFGLSINSSYFCPFVLITFLNSLDPDQDRSGSKLFDIPIVYVPEEIFEN